MFTNFNYKIFALALSAVFWIFIVSFENLFAPFPQEVPVQALNIGQDLALKNSLPTVKLIVKSESHDALRRLSVLDFDAYADLSHVGIGRHEVAVVAVSKISGISVVRAVPSSVTVDLEQVRQKAIILKAETVGNPSQGASVEKIELAESQVTIRGPESIVAGISGAKAMIFFDGTERGEVTKKAQIMFSKDSAIPPNVTFEFLEVDALVKLKEPASEKTVGIRPKFSNALFSGTVKNISTSPSIITITGKSEVLREINTIETETVDLSQIVSTKTVTVKLLLPEEISLAKGEKGTVQVRVEIEF